MSANCFQTSLGLVWNPVFLMEFYRNQIPIVLVTVAVFGTTISFQRKGSYIGTFFEGKKNPIPPIGFFSRKKCKKTGALMPSLFFGRHLSGSQKLGPKHSFLFESLLNWGLLIGPLPFTGTWPSKTFSANPSVLQSFFCGSSVLQSSIPWCAILSEVFA